MLLSALLRRIVKRGTLTVIDAGGTHHRFEGPSPGQSVTVRLHDRRLHSRLFFNPDLILGEAYVDGTLTVEDGDVYDLLAMIASNIGWGHADHWVQGALNAMRRWTRWVAQNNVIARARRNVAHHYDLSDRLYSQFLDDDWQYSCAYFADPDDSLETAQFQKKEHLAAKLLLSPGQRVLDIGCGWGGLALHLAKAAGVEVHGITLSEQQYKVARERAAAEGLGDRVTFELIDYREVEGPFDRIVSVGMFEHVGIRHYRTFFRKVRELLRPDGIAVLHTIGRAEGPGATNAWIDKYIFPGGYSPALSEVVPHVEQSAMYITDVEVLRLHYAETVKAWRKRFVRNRDKIAEIYDERFCRMWEFYLAASETVFRFGGHVVFQIQMSICQDAVPLVRDYITDFERQHRERSAAA